MKNLNRLDIALLFLLTLVTVALFSFLATERGTNVPELLFSGIFIFTIQGIINLFLSRNIESYKNEMIRDNQNAIQALTLSLESFKSDLGLTLTKQSKLYEHRLLIISDLYGKIVHLHQKMTEMTLKARYVPRDVTMEEEQENKRIQVTLEAFNDFLIFYLRNKIYLSPDTCKKIDSIQKEYAGVFHDYTIDKRLLNPSTRDTFDIKFKTSDTIDQTIKPILEQIELDFRELLGVK